ncbi:MAG: hypothetical protein WDN10_05250 [bacterium]
MRERPDWMKYAFAFIITAAIFATAFYVSTLFDRARVESIQNTADKISIDIISLETQFDLISDVACSALESHAVLPSEINTLASRLGSAEQSLGADNERVIQLKEQYSLLEIKDYLITERVKERCGEGKAPVSVLYFYSNQGDCSDCTDAGYALDALRQEFPSLRVYSFDYNLPLGALETLISLLKIKPAPPVFVIDGETHYGFDSLATLKSYLPKRLLDEEASPTAATASTTRKQ